MLAGVQKEEAVCHVILNLPNAATLNKVPYGVVTSNHNIIFVATFITVILLLLRIVM